MSDPNQVRLTPTVWTWSMLVVGVPAGLLMTGCMYVFPLAFIADPSQFGQAGSTPLARAISSLVFLLFLILGGYGIGSIFLAVFVRHSRILIDGGRHQATLRPLIGGGRVVHFDQLIGYSSCSLPSWITPVESGVALYMKNGDHIQLSERSINELGPLRKALRNGGVNWLGKERCWFYPFKKGRFKFDPK
jgi:hypothetical protein